MLGKLLKYEFRSTARYYLPIYAALGVVAGLAGLVNLLRDGMSLIWFMAAAIYGLLAMALAVVTFVVTVSRFYKNLLGAEGYLMFTLPVSTDVNILAKLIAALCWSLGSLALGLLTLLAFGLDGGGQGSISALGHFFAEHSADIAANLGGIIFFLALLILGVAASVLFCYLCMAIGQLFNEHKFLASVGAYLVLQTLMQIFSIASVAGLAGLIDRLDWELLALAPPDWAICGGILAALLAACAVEYFITRWLLDKKLNLA